MPRCPNCLFIAIKLTRECFKNPIPDTFIFNIQTVKEDDCCVAQMNFSVKKVLDLDWPVLDKESKKENFQNSHCSPSVWCY